MKLYVDTSAKQITVTLEPVEKKDQNGRQRTERDTGRPMWSTQVFVLDDNGGEVITVTTAGERPNVSVGQPVQAGGPALVDQWAQRRGVSRGGDQDGDDLGQVCLTGLLPASGVIPALVTVLALCQPRSVSPCGRDWRCCRMSSRKERKGRPLCGSVGRRRVRRCKT